MVRFWFSLIVRAEAVDFALSPFPPPLLLPSLIWPIIIRLFSFCYYYDIALAWLIINLCVPTTRAKKPVWETALDEKRRNKRDVRPGAMCVPCRCMNWKEQSREGVCYNEFVRSDLPRLERIHFGWHFLPLLFSAFSATLLRSSCRSAARTSFPLLPSPFMSWLGL